MSIDFSPLLYFTGPVTKPYSHNIACLLKLFYAAVNSRALKRSSFVAASTDYTCTQTSWDRNLKDFHGDASNCVQYHELFLLK